MFEDCDGDDDVVGCRSARLQSILHLIFALGHTAETQILQHSDAGHQKSCK